MAGWDAQWQAGAHSGRSQFKRSTTSSSGGVQVRVRADDAQIAEISWWTLAGQRGRVAQSLPTLR